MNTHTRNKRTMTLGCEALDERVVPSSFGRSVNLRARHHAAALRLNSPAVSRVNLDLARAATAHQATGAASAALVGSTTGPVGPGGFRAVVTTPDGPAGLNQGTFNVASPSLSVTPEQPLSPGGFTAIVTTPDGPAGLNSFRR